MAYNPSNNKNENKNSPNEFILPSTSYTSSGGVKADNTAWAEFNSTNGILTFKYGENKPNSTEQITIYALNQGNERPEWNDNHGNYALKKVIFDKSFKDARPTSCYMWFYTTYALTEIDGIENLNTEETTNMGSMFNHATELENIDVTNFNTSKVTNMSGMFCACEKLLSLDVSKFDTKNVTSMSNMFGLCKKLTTIDVSGFNTSKVTSMHYMFAKCYLLKRLDLTSFDTKNVRDMLGMFQNDNSLTSLDLSNFDINNHCKLYNMLSGCSALSSIILPEGFDITESGYSYNSGSIFTSPLQYNDYIENTSLQGNTIKSYVKVNNENEYDIICLPLSYTIAEGTHTGFDKAFNVTIENNQVTLTETGKMKAGVAYVYHKTIGTSKPNKVVRKQDYYNNGQTEDMITFIPDNAPLVKEPYTDTDAQGVFEKTKVPVGCYVIQNGKFHKVTEGEEIYTSNYGGYLKDVSTNQDLNYEITTEIKNITNNTPKGVRIYDITGHNISSPQKGKLYIKDGKKVVF